MRNKENLGHFLTYFENVIFDLDGVILDSAQLKISCMRETLSNFDRKLIELYLNDFTQNFGQSRLFHFKNLYHNYLNLKDGFDGFYDIYANRYAAILEKCYPQVTICEHSDTLIALLKNIGLNLFVATGTATSEAINVLTKKNLSHYFKEILGSPTEKSNIIKNILFENGYSNEKTLLIGDAMHDRDSAFENQISFLFVERYALADRHDLIKNSKCPFYSVNSLKHTECVEINCIRAA